MSRLVARILLSILMFPLATVFYLIVMEYAEPALIGRAPETIIFIVSPAITWLAVAVYWCLLWRSAVVWNSFRIRATIFAVVAAAAAGLLAGLLGELLLGSFFHWFGVFLGGFLAMVLWLIATVFIWRETPTERAARVKSSSHSAITCPTCGYNLTGLTQSRCPECGAQFTLNELMSLQLSTDKDIE